jgi:hypothetical protein
MHRSVCGEHLGVDTEEGVFELGVVCHDPTGDDKRSPRRADELGDEQAARERLGHRDRVVAVGERRDDLGAQ